MKYNIIKYYSFALFFLLQPYCKAQNYSYFPDRNAYWSQREVYNDGGGITENIYTLFIDGDSLINGFIYHNYYKSGIENYYTPFWVYISSTNYNHVLMGSIREDSLKHIYLYDSSSDILLYDFNLQLNDTLDHSAYLYTLANGTYVSLIDSIWDGINYRKRYHLTAHNLASDYITLIEGIGSSFGVLKFTGPPFEQSGNLFCFRSDSGNYTLDSINCSFVNINRIEINNSIIVFPNPSIGQLNLMIKENIKTPFKINIYSEFGNEIYSKTLDELAENEVFILPFNLTRGIYILSIQIEGKTKYIKYIVI